MFLHLSIYMLHFTIKKKMFLKVFLTGKALAPSWRLRKTMWGHLLMTEA